jgi:hypothetical protein
MLPPVRFADRRFRSHRFAIYHFVDGPSVTVTKQRAQRCPLAASAHRSDFGYASGQSVAVYQRGGSMRQGVKRFLCAIALVCISFLLQKSVPAQNAVPSPLAGIDHIPLVVTSLEEASEHYGRLGFALKPGRFHDNGIRNAHVKFPDGAGIELITASKAGDAQAARYLELLAAGEGPAYVSFHARSTDRLTASLAAAAIRYSLESGAVIPLDPRLSFIFFVRDNRSSTDRPAHFAHANSAMAMTEVWIAAGDASALSELLNALGAVAKKEKVFVPEPTSATVFAMENGKVVLLPEAHQRIKGRPIVGASFRVSDLDAVARTLASANISAVRVGKEGGSPRLLVPPQAAHGIWLGFSEH